MIAAPAYIAVRFFQRLIGFFSHWYVGGTRALWSRTAKTLRLYEKLFSRAQKGGVLGFLMWVLRSSFGVLVYALVIFASFFLYAAWAALLPYILLKVLEGVIL